MSGRGLKIIAPDGVGIMSAAAVAALSPVAFFHSDPCLTTPAEARADFLCAEGGTKIDSNWRRRFHVSCK